MNLEEKHKSGSVENFDKDWNTRKESNYSHYTRCEPVNQIQLAFRQHFLLFKELEKKLSYNNGLEFLEIGCGRGSLSSYYAENGYNCTLLDSSEKAIELAKRAFEANSFQGSFYVGNCEDLPFEDESYDIVASIGLMEHFDDVSPTIKEQHRILKPGGLMIMYVVPECNPKVDDEYEWINKIIKSYYSKEIINEKLDVYRTSYDSKVYSKEIEKLKMKEIFVSGVYPLPMISHSPQFPFSLMPDEAELSLVKKFNEILQNRQNKNCQNGWLCDENYGQAFVVAAKK